MIKLVRDYQNVHRVKAKGRTYFYHRVTRDKLPDPEYDPAGFDAAWVRAEAAAARTRASVGADRQPAGSFGALIAAYRGSQQFSNKAAKTRRDYSRYLDRLGALWGALPVAELTRPDIFELRDRFEETPRTANYLVQVLSLLLTYSVDRGYRPDNPALRINRLPADGQHRPWEDHEIAAFCRHWPDDSLQRVAFELILNSGMRGTDACQLTRAQIRDGVIRFRPSKTRRRTDDRVNLIELPISARLGAVLLPWLDRQPHMMVLTTPTGRPVTEDYLRHMMRGAYTESALEDVTTHGLRYTAGAILYELGVGEADIQTLLGHATLQMTRAYLARRRQSRLAISRLDAARHGTNRDDEL